MKNTKRILSLVLALSLCFALGISAFATNDNVTTSSGGTATSNVTLTATAANFKVTVPTTIALSIDGDGNVTAPDNLEITNDGYAQIQVDSVVVSGANSWELVDNTTDYTEMAPNQKMFGININGDDVSPDDGLANMDTFMPINGQDSETFTVEATACPQTSSFTASNIATIVFTVSWLENE